jgi:CRISPR-associated endonuclease/helicase Cas3
MNTVELAFPVRGDTLPVNHGYPLYASLARRVPGLHVAAMPLSIGPIQGDYLGNAILRLNAKSWLRLRLPPEGILTVLPLAGQALDVAGHKVRLGVPHVQGLVPTPTLVARIVTMKVHGIPNPGPEQFLEAVRRRLSESWITGEPCLPLIRTGPHAGQPRRQIIRVKDATLTGFALEITGLSSEDSLRLQGDSPFARRRMGCSFFVPVKAEENRHDL